MAADYIDLLCDPFFDLVEPLGRHPKGHPVVQLGHLVTAHQIHPDRAPFVVDVTGFDPRDPAQARYIIARNDPASPPARHFPIKELNLASDEHYYLMRGKSRPAIVLQTITSAFYNAANPEPYVLIAPCFTFKEKHSPDYRLRIATMEIPHLFYLPAHRAGCREPSVIRFEHIQPVPAAGVQPFFVDGKQSALSREAWTLLQHQLHRFLTGRILDEGVEESISTYRQLIQEQTKKS